MNLQRIWRLKRQCQPKVVSMQIENSVNDLMVQNMHTKGTGKFSQLCLTRLYSNENIFKYPGKENLGLCYDHYYFLIYKSLSYVLEILFC